MSAPDEDHSRMITAGAPIAALMEVPRWVGWRFEPRKAGGKPTKVPYQPGSGRPAKTNDSTTWGQFSAAERMQGVDGVGLALHGLPQLAALDLDGCRDKGTGRIATWAKRLCERAQSYTEITPSGTGLRILGIADGVLPTIKTLPRGERQQVEVFCGGAAKYVTVTFARLHSYPPGLEDISAVVRELLAEGEAKRQPGSPSQPRPGSNADELLAALPNDYGRDHWVRLGLAHKAAGGTLESFHAWSQQHPSYDAAETRRVWESLRPNGAIGAGSLRHELRQRGIEPPPAEPPAVEESPAKPGAGFPLRLYRDFNTSSVKRWIVPGLLGSSEFSCFFGEPGSGKSVLLGDCALHVAANARKPLPWFGRTINGGLAVFFALERPLNVERRALAFRQSSGLDDIPFAIVRGPVNFREPGTAAKILDTIRRAEDAFGCELALLSVDTVSAALCGGDENSPKDLGAFVSTMLSVLGHFDKAHITATHHQPHDAARLRGHGVLLGAIDMTDEVVNDGRRRSATVRKNNDGPEGARLAFTLRSVTIGHDEAGTPTEAPLVVPDDSSEATSAQAQRKVKLPAGAQIALQALVEAVDEIGAEPPASNHIPPRIRAVTTAQWRDYCYRRGISSGEPRAQQKAFNRAGECLRASGKIGTWEPFVWPA
jgi:hypothetical protein